MALFQVPGWSVPDAPISQALHNSKKRKRPSETDHAGPSSSTSSSLKLRSAVQNVEKLMASLGTDGDAPAKLQKKKQAKKGRGDDEKKRNEIANESQSPKQKGKQRVVRDAGNVSRAKGKGKDTTSATETTKGSAIRPTKKHKKDKSQNGEHSSDKTPHPSPAPEPSGRAGNGQGKGKKKEGGLTALQASMKHSLDGARFRWINETLYKSDSSSAHDMMRENPTIFFEYHTGFRHQVHSWPDNPVSHYISTLPSRPSGTIIVDLGCGDAALAKALVPKGLVVLSYDLVSDGEFIVEADICAKIPLPGSEEDMNEEDTNAQVVDVVVCALSLMSTNWVGCVREAWRVLKLKGELKIAEVSSRFTDMEAFVSVVSAVGFKLKSKDESNTHFTLFEFVKVLRAPKTEKEWQKLMERGSILKPCEYKRR
ncbi:ribosomal RNA-processing protein 8 [Irpex rosettiformis]|uniref:Ribosomal RNA-processing protein 8 n=1 Tax=Irpex rosettiformis TaxID=378272 RepID=A0ACB8UDU4_9APHY|nr:ribosomal RNA-processing protein 8 [Irpex rosettiformis]